MKFELFMCCQGNGITLCNKAVEENRDYKTIGHISPAGNIKLFVGENYIPSDDMKRIEKVAAYNREKFIESIKNNIKYRFAEFYYEVIDSIPYGEYSSWMKETEGMSKIEKFRKLIPIYLKNN